MTEFCGDSVCHARIQIWLIVPEDGGISEPCSQCLDTLVAMFGIATDEPLTLRSLHSAIAGRL